MAKRSQEKGDTILIAMKEKIEKAIKEATEALTNI